MATVGKVNEHDAFTCPICLETLKSPKSLPCLHTFCETCIGEFILSTEQRTEQKLLNYPCPVCRTIVTPNPKAETSQWAASLPHNLKISSLMDNAKNVKQDCHLCQRRDKISEATQWCRDCSEALCEECLQFHGIMKLYAEHKVVLIEEIDSPLLLDLNMVSDSCPVHPSKFFEAFCFDHQALCCVFCLTLEHRKCEKVQVIEELQHIKKGRINVLESEVTAVKLKIEKMSRDMKVNKDRTDAVFTDIEVETKAFISSLKDKLDSLLALFMKELNINREESKHEFMNKLKTFDKLSNYFDKLQSMTKTVEKRGSPHQMFVHFEQSKTELKSVLVNSCQVFNTNTICEAKLVKTAILGQVENVDRLGEFELKRTNRIEIEKYIEQFFPPNCLVMKETKPQTSFENIQLKHNKTICLCDFNVHGGAFISENVIVIGGNDGNEFGMVKVVNISNESLIYECTFENNVKRLAYDFENKSLFVSCNGSKIFSLNNDDFSNKINLKDGGLSNGDMCVLEGVLYVVVGKTIQKIALKNLQSGLLEICFDTDTNCSNLNGLDSDSKHKRLLYTSETSELVCASLSGKEIFRYKDECFKEVQSLAVHSDGCIFVADGIEEPKKSRSIHVISEDGKRRRTVLHNCLEKEPIRDLCFDQFSDRLAVFEPSFVEIYDVC